MGAAVLNGRRRFYFSKLAMNSQADSHHSARATKTGAAI